MAKRKRALKLRKAHRYLGLFIGIQFIMWTVSGMYFSSTDINEIHGEQFRKHHVEQVSFSSLRAPTEMPGGVKSLQLKDIAGRRVFSLLGLITVLSGFVLWYISSPSVRKMLKKF